MHLLRSVGATIPAAPFDRRGFAAPVRPGPHTPIVGTPLRFPHSPAHHGPAPALQHRRDRAASRVARRDRRWTFRSGRRGHGQASGHTRRTGAGSENVTRFVEAAVRMDARELARMLNASARKAVSRQRSRSLLFPPFVRSGSVGRAETAASVANISPRNRSRRGSIVPSLLVPVRGIAWCSRADPTTFIGLVSMPSR